VPRHKRAGAADLDRPGAVLTHSSSPPVLRLMMPIDPPAPILEISDAVH
jgi:hypothetical protein